MPRKERGPNRFRRTEFARAIQAANQVGARAVEIDPATGKIRVFLGDEPVSEDKCINPWDEVHDQNKKRTS
jgi:hypothetical protein